MKPFLILISWGVIIGFAGCGKSPNQNGSPSVRALAESFNNFDDFSALVARSNSTTIYEGLPNNYWERELYDRELKTKQRSRLKAMTSTLGRYQPRPLLLMNCEVWQAPSRRSSHFRGQKLAAAFILIGVWCGAMAQRRTLYFFASGAMRWWPIRTANGVFIAIFEKNRDSNRF
jgi:hypothetical protein